MNTPAHAVLNLVVLGRSERPQHVWPILAGGFVPDLPIVVLYLVEKVRGTSEQLIWSQAYFAPSWQLFIDLWNGLPLIALGFLVARSVGAGGLQAFFASMGLHALCDLPLHREDAHRHFLPLSDWRFESPVSYWDPAHGGLWVTVIEIALVLAASTLILRRFPQRGVRFGVVALVLLYLAYFGFVALVWL